jgi:hypothetical protein
VNNRETVEGLTRTRGLVLYTGDIEGSTLIINSSPFYTGTLVATPF